MLMLVGELGNTRPDEKDQVNSAEQEAGVLSSQPKRPVGDRFGDRPAPQYTFEDGDNLLCVDLGYCIQHLEFEGPEKKR